MSGGVLVLGYGVGYAEWEVEHAQMDGVLVPLCWQAGTRVRLCVVQATKATIPSKRNPC